MKISIVWFKRDLRVYDNFALSNALNNSDLIIPLYIIEPDLWLEDDLSYRQYKFLIESLKDLDINLKNLGQGLIVRVGKAEQVIADLIVKYKISAIYSHQETWNYWTFQRDINIKKILKNYNVIWNEYRQNGVVRFLKNRDKFSYNWYKMMNDNLVLYPIKINKIDIASDKIPKAQDLNIEFDQIVSPQIGGRSEGLVLLDSFLNHRSVNYQKNMSSPVTAFENCSRLSPHIAFGTLSIREIYQKAKTKLEYLQQDESLKTHIKSLKSFISRLHWHCHFIQKLEDEPEIEFKNLHKAYDNLDREIIDKKSLNHKFEAWKNGKTGFPMIDSCMRSLIATGWINFRMRAMLMSFASYHLWLDWRITAKYLARLFIDYEPGIHYSQVQMQSGTTGINAVRIYNPIKQGLDHDKDGIFIKKWLPELENMPIKYIHFPWLKPELAGSYPMPIIDEVKARKQALKSIYNIRGGNDFKEKAQQIFQKHGSRKKSNIKNKKNISKEDNKIQLSLL